MRPLSQLLDEHLCRGSDSWEQEQRTALATASLSGADDQLPRQSALLEYLHLTSERRFLAELAALRHEQQWTEFDEAQHTRSFQALIFRLLSRMGCLVQQLLIAPTRRRPLKIFKVVEGGREEAERLHQELQDFPCIFDTWSSTLLHVGHWEKEKGWAVMQALAHSTTVDTAHVGESSRSSFSSPSKSECADQSTHLCFPECTAGVCQVQGKTVHHQHLQSSRCLSQSARFHNPGIRRGCAFAAEDSRGRRALESLPEPEEKRCAWPQSPRPSMRRSGEKEAKSGRGSKRLGGQAPNYTGRQVGTPLVSRQDRSRSRKLATQAAQVGAGSTGPSLAEDVGQVLRSGDCSALADSFNLAADIKHLRSQARETGKEKRMERERKRQTLERYLAERKGPILEAAMQLVPDLITWSDALHLEPFHEFCLLQVSFDNLVKTQHIASWMMEHTRTCNLKKVLSESWQSDNAVVQHKDTETVVQAPAPRGHRACKTYGLPLCTPSGQRTFAVRNRFLLQLKHLCQRKTEDCKVLLQEGFVVARLQQSSLAADAVPNSDLSEDRGQC